MSALAPKTELNFAENLSKLREAMGIMQHHDAVTGTEKQHVANDYAYLLNKAIDLCGSNTQEVLNQLTHLDDVPLQNRSTNYDPNHRFEFETCGYLNISSCHISENSNQFIVTVYNPLAHSTFQYVRVPVVVGSEYVVKDYRDVLIASQLVPIPDEVQQLTFRRSVSGIELVFLAVELPPMGYKSYFIEKKPVPNEPNVVMVTDDDFQSDQAASIDAIDAIDATDITGPVTIGNKYLNATFDKNGLLQSLQGNGQSINVAQNFYEYEAALGDNREFKNRSSGAYIFRPNGTEASPIVTKATIRVINGPIVDEVQQKFNDWISQVVRIYKDENIVELEWLVGDIPIDDKTGREIVSRFDTDIRTGGVFYTDSNGREMLKRQRDHRDTWALNLTEKIAGNYYPVTAKIAIEDDQKRFAVLNDRSQGGSSLADGSVELMVHRRLLHDDAFGVDEALNETAFGKGLIVRGRHYIVFGSKDKSIKPSVEANERFVQLNKLLPGWLFFSKANKLTYADWMDSYKNIVSTNGLTFVIRCAHKMTLFDDIVLFQYSAQSLSLPQNVHVLTFEPWKDGSILIRFEHILGKGEDAEYSKTVTFNFQDVFRDLGVSSIQETTLAANQWLSESSPLQFKSETHESPRQLRANETDPDQPVNAQPTPSNLDIHPEVSERHYRRTEFKEPERRMEVGTVADVFQISLKPMQIRTFILEF